MVQGARWWEEVGGGGRRWEVMHIYTCVHETEGCVRSRKRYVYACVHETEGHLRTETRQRPRHQLYGQ